jgi:hypothetical protein
VQENIWKSQNLSNVKRTRGEEEGGGNGGKGEKEGGREMKGQKREE